MTDMKRLFEIETRCQHAPTFTKMPAGVLCQAAKQTQAENILIGGACTNSACSKLSIENQV